MRPSATGNGRPRSGRAIAAGATVLLVAAGTFVGPPPASAIDRPVIDPAAVPPNDPPGPLVPMRQSAYCTEVGVLPGTDFRVQPKYMDMLNLPEAWRFGRGGGVKVAVIDTGVSPHPRLPHLVGGGDYVVAGGDGLSDCDAHGTIVASMIAAEPATGALPSGPPRKPPPVPTNEPPPPPQTVTLSPPAPTTVIVPPLNPPEDQGLLPLPPQFGAPPPNAPAATSGSGAVVTPGYSGGGHVVVADHIRPAAPPSPGQPGDAFSGVAPDVEIISIRFTSAAFSPKDAFTGNTDPQTAQKIDKIRTMARAIVHAADMGASVINLSEVVCMSARSIIDEPDLGAAVYYAAVDKDAVVVAAAGDTSQQDCKENPVYNPLQPNDPRDWNGVNTVVTPSWFNNYVLTVGATDASGTPLDKASLAGPWVSIAAPGTDVEGLSPRSDNLINAIDGPNNTLLVPSGTSFSTAIVSGAVALVRAKYPQLSAQQVIDRLLRTATPPARGVDNQIGYGVLDLVAALTWDVPDGPPPPPKALAAPLQLPPPPAPRDMTPVWVAAGGFVAALLVAGAFFGGGRLMRRLGGRS
jgi:membrane-anchored mycosin MYCP